jgi:hypothetical protein
MKSAPVTAGAFCVFEDEVGYSMKAPLRRSPAYFTSARKR